MKMNFRIGCTTPTALARIGASDAWADITMDTILTATGRNASIGIPGKNTPEGYPTTIAGQNV